MTSRCDTGGDRVGAPPEVSVRLKHSVLVFILCLSSIYDIKGVCFFSIHIIVITKGKAKKKKKDQRVLRNRIILKLPWVKLPPRDHQTVE